MHPLIVNALTSDAPWSIPTLSQFCNTPPQKPDNRPVMSRRLGGVPKARGHIQGGKSYKTGVLQHPIALQRSDCQSHVKRAKGTSLRPDRIICKLIALRHVPTPGHINLPKKILMLPASGHKKRVSYLHRAAQPVTAASVKI